MSSSFHEVPNFLSFNFLSFNFFIFSDVFKRNKMLKLIIRLIYLSEIINFVVLVNCFKISIKTLFIKKIHLSLNEIF